jgi:WD40 repeat protein
VADLEWVQGFLLPELGLPKDRVISNQLLTTGAAPFELGAPMLEEFQRAVTGSRFTLLILSPAYLADVWGPYGERLASYLSLQEQSNRLIPLVKKTSKLPLDIQFRVRLDCTEDENWKPAAARLRELLNRPEPTEERIPCPYPGMVPFQEKDARFFYGREDEIERMVQHFRHQRLLFVIGPSGCGKSSLVFAGLLPQLQRSNSFDEGFWLVRRMRPGPHPVQELRSVLSGDPDETSVAKLLGANPPTQRLMLFVDQFEEVFSQAQRLEQNGFITALRRLREVERCALLITLRADFYPDLMNSDIWQEASSHRLDIAPLRGNALRHAIEKPAADVSVFVEPRLLDRILKDAADEPGVLPLVQETMVVLWEKMQRRLLTLSAYDRLGSDGRNGIALAIVSKADATLANLSAQQRSIARRIFLRLVQFGEGRADTRRQQAVAELDSEKEESMLFNSTLQHLANNRLLTLTGGEKGGTSMQVDMAHEALLTGWPVLHEWVNQRRNAEKQRRALEAKVQEWDRLGRQEGGLLDAVELKEAEQWLETPDAVDLGSGKLPDLVKASRETVERIEQEKKAANQRQLEQLQALADERHARLVETQRLRLLSIAQALAAQVPRQLERNQHERAALLARQAYLFNERYQGTILAEIDEALRSALTMSNFSSILRIGRVVQRMRENTVESVAFESDGTRFAVGCSDGTVQIRDVTDPGSSPLVLPPDFGAVSSVAFHPDRTRLATGGVFGNVVIRPLTTPGVAPMVLSKAKSQPHEIYSIAFDLDGKRLASGELDGTVRVWNLAAPRKRPLILARHKGSVTSVAFQPGGKRLASGGDDGVVLLWNLAAPSASPVVASRHKSSVTSVAFRPDGNGLASASQDGTVLLRDLAAAAKTQLMLSNGSWVSSITFHPDGKQLATGDINGSLRIWDLRKPRAPPLVLPGHQDAIHSVAFDVGGTWLVSGDALTVRVCDMSVPAAAPLIIRNECSTSSVAFDPRGTTLVAGDEEHNVKMWDLANPGGPPLVLSGHESEVHSVAVHPNGERLASGDLDGTVRIWDLADRADEPIVLSSHESEVQSVAFSPNGKRLASGSEDDTVRIWDVADLSAAPLVLASEGGGWSVAFGPDSERLASGGEESTVRVWNLADPNEAPVILRGHRDRVDSVAFHPDGKRLASGSEDYSVGVWNLADRNSAPSFLYGHEGEVFSVAFDPNGRLATGAKDRTVRVWDITAPEAAPVVLHAEGEGISSVAFDRDGRRLASGSWDGTIRVWIADTAELAEMVCRKVWRNLTLNEWRDFIGADIPYERTCPNLPSAEDREGRVVPMKEPPLTNTI